MKKVIALLLVFATVFFACSCGKKTANTPEDKYVFESSKTQKVYKNNNNYMIFYYKDDKISGIDTVMTFQTEEAAKSSLEVLKKGGSDNSDVALEGKYIVMHMNDTYLSDYLKMSSEGIESYLKAQGYILVEKVGDETTAAPTTAAPTTAAPTTKADEKATTAAAKK